MLLAALKCAEGIVAKPFANSEPSLKRDASLELVTGGCRRSYTSVTASNSPAAIQILSSLEEQIEVFATLLAYAGSYYVESDKAIHQVATAELMRR